MEGGASQQTGFFPTYLELSLSVEFEVPDKDGLQSWGLNYMAVFPGGSQAGGCPPLREEGFPWKMNMWMWGHTSGDLHPSGWLSGLPGTSLGRQSPCAGGPVLGARPGACA